MDRLAPYMAGLFTYRDWIRSDPTHAELKVSMKEPAGVVETSRESCNIWQGQA